MGLIISKKPSKKVPKGENNCNICWGDYLNNSQLRICQSCGYIACKDCIEEWFKTTNACPICREQRSWQNVTYKWVPPPVIEWMGLEQAMREPPPLIRTRVVVSTLSQNGEMAVVSQTRTMVPTTLAPTPGPRFRPTPTPAPAET